MKPYLPMPELTALTIARFQAKVWDTGSCLEWRGHLGQHGYGVVWIDGHRYLAHRVAWWIANGEIPDNKTLDHLCRNTICVNVAHLDPATIAENVDRGTSGQWQRDKTHCPSGHPYDEKNTRRYRGRRYCRACSREKNRISEDLRTRAVRSDRKT